MPNTATIFLRSFRRLSFSNISALLLIGLQNPLLCAIAFYATIKTYNIAKKYFPETNSTDGIGNAFRHALWCCLIIMYCCKISSVDKSIAFCRKITTLHEELFPNEPIQRAMDLHNNEVGIAYFQELLPGIHRQFFETSFFIDAFLEKTKAALPVQTVLEIQGKELVYVKRNI